MQTSDNSVSVRSNVRRDLLQTAALFNTDKKMVWEYVSNGLQYVDPGVNPVVRVDLDTRGKRIVVSDNGRGMDLAGLQNFFVMHGENLDRKHGRPGRGRFGTGKAAGFGIGDVLRVRTVRNGVRCTVELTRQDIDAMADEDSIPVRVLEDSAPTDEPNGTRVEVDGIHLRSLDQTGVVRYIERQLARWPKSCLVFVNGHECEFADPPVAEERRFRPTGEERGTLGDVELIIRVAKAPLEEELRGVSIYANGVWLETTLAGNEAREMVNYVFGEIDIPQLDDDQSPIPAFDVTRSMQLNRANELVQHLYAFIGERVDEVRRDLARADRERRASEEAKRLAKQASEIAELINAHFRGFEQRVSRARALAAGASDPGPMGIGAGTEESDLLAGSELPAEVVSPTGGPGHGDGVGGDGSRAPNLGPVVAPAPPDRESRARAAGGEGVGVRSRGGFRVEFSNLGSEEHRAKYVPEERTIYINLDHPQVAAAKGLASIDDLAFRRLAYEVAFSEYAIALASELAARDEYLDPSDPIVEIRETVNDLARKAAHLYSGQHP